MGNAAQGKMPGPVGSRYRHFDPILHYRFNPAMKNDIEPVLVIITVELNFHLYEEAP